MLEELGRAKGQEKMEKVKDDDLLKCAIHKRAKFCKLGQPSLAVKTPGDSSVGRFDSSVGCQDPW
jgi:hypothetical protein